MANVSDKIAAIRQAVKGLYVRSSIADGIEAINEEVENTTQRQTTLENNMNLLANNLNEAESNRVNAENTRVSSEQARASAESNRASEFNNIKNAYENATHENTVVELTAARHDNITNTDYNDIGKRMDDHSSQLAEKATHTKLLAQAYQKLNKKLDMTIVSEGTSLTYGQDTTSIDKVNPTGTTDNGVAHTIAHASTTYPMALQTYLRDIYNNSTVVINKGYSGDWAEASYNHWNVNSHADIAIIELMTNDSNYSASWVPSDVKGNIDKYLTDMRRIIRRYISWGTAVILLTAPRLRDPEDPTTTSSWNIEPYRHAAMILADEFGCPVIDAETFLNGCDYTYYSDNVHLNSKGYQYFASRLVSVLIGYGVKNPVKIKSGDDLSIRQTRDNFVSNGVTVATSINSEGAEEGANGQGILATMPANSEIFYGFETLEDNLILIPIYSVSGTSIEIDLDFANEQGSIPILSGANLAIPQGTKPLSSISSATSTANSGGSAWNGTININTTDRFLWITNKGWHNIKVTNGTSSGTVYFNGFVVMSLKDFITQGQISSLSSVPSLVGYTTAGSPTYTTRVCKYSVDVKNRKVHTEINLVATMDSLVDGTLVVRMNNSINAANGSACNVAYVGGFFANQTPIYAWLQTGSNDIVIQFIDTSGAIQALNGSTIRNKTVRIFLTVDYLY